MNSLVKVIGEIVLSILIVFTPMLAAFSFCLNWFDDIKWIQWILILLTAVDIISVGTMIDIIIRKSTS